MAEKVLDRAGITVNKNLIPYDPRSPKVTSGIRVGSPALTSQGFGMAEMETIGKLIRRMLRSPDDDTELLLFGVKCVTSQTLSL